MKPTPAFAILLCSVLCAFAEPLTEYRTCPACLGQHQPNSRSLSITPPNLGQHDGEIGVTPGQPFKTHRWDNVIDRCPVCAGKGRLEMFKTRVKPPKAEDVEGLEICLDCRWSGVTPCRKCLKTGVTPCSACRSSAQGGGKPGWIKSEKRTSGRTSRHVKIIVTPCATCQGLGKVVCPDCLGKGAVPCRKCHGEGGVPKKEKR